MITAEVTFREGARFDCQTRGHAIVCDQPLEAGGSDRGMTPPELFLSALGACAGYYAAEYLKARNLPLQGLRITVAAEKTPRPVRLEPIVIEVEAPDLESRYLDGLRRAVESCLIHRTLKSAPHVEIAVNAADEALVVV